MNKYFESENDYISNNRIFEAYFTEAKVAPHPLKKVFEAILSFFATILSALTSARAKALYPVVAVALCVVALIGLIGAVEHGSLSMGWAFLIGLVFLGIEILCLKKRGHSD